MSSRLAQVTRSNFEATLRWSLRFALTSSVLVISVLQFLKSRVQDKWNQYSVGSVIHHLIVGNHLHAGFESHPGFRDEHDYKVIVLTNFEKENFYWV